MKKILAPSLLFLTISLSAQEFTILQSRPETPGKVELTVDNVTSGSAFRPSKPKVWPEEMGPVPDRNALPKAFTKGRDLWYMDRDSVERAVALSEDPCISYGCSVSRDEFGIKDGIFWSDDKSRLAFYRKDESAVSDFPLLDITTRCGTLKSIKYPMNGMASERVDLGIYDLQSGRTVYVDAEEFTSERYLCGISWSPDSRYVFIQVLDRSQHHLKLNMYRAADGSFVRTLLTEDNDAWVEPQEGIHFLKGSYGFIYTTDNRDGFKNLYLCDTLGGVRRLTDVDADVKYVGNDGVNVYYTSAEVSPLENHLFSIACKKSRKGTVPGNPRRLTSEPGWHDVRLSADCKYFLDTYSSFTVPCVQQLKKTDGSFVKVLSESPDPLADCRMGEVRELSVPSADGQFDNYGFLLLPPDFDPQKKYPVIVYVYGGPHSQLVRNSWLAGASLWDVSMAQKGYIVYTQDNRGTLNRGAAFEKAINRRCGQAEMEDQMMGILALKALPYVDSERIGVDGWSYGGFMTISLMVNHPDVFKVAVAGGPVIDWKWYEIMYGERYMDTAQTNPEGFALTSLVDKVEALRDRKLLIIQGALDGTVLWEHSLSFVQNCIQKDVPVEYFPYPCSEHNVRGAWRVHLNRKITDYFLDNL